MKYERRLVYVDTRTESLERILNAYGEWKVLWMKRTSPGNYTIIFEREAA